LTTQASAQGVELETWMRFLRAHATITRRLNADLISTQGLTLNDYEVLLQLAHAPERALRRVDLADRLLLTPSGITRLLEGLEQGGLVERASCPSDGRVVYAHLTDRGYDRLRAASGTHLAGIDELFIGRYDADELEALHRLLGRLSDTDADGADCGVE
jgi:DNA-binding MarR family transcriptional regulator